MLEGSERLEGNFQTDFLQIGRNDKGYTRNPTTQQFEEAFGVFLQILFGYVAFNTLDEGEKEILDAMSRGEAIGIDEKTKKQIEDKVWAELNKIPGFSRDIVAGFENGTPDIMMQLIAKFVNTYHAEVITKQAA